MNLQDDDDVVIRFLNDTQLDVCTHLNEDEEPVFEQKTILAGTEVEVFVLDFVQRDVEPIHCFYQMQLPDGGIISVPEDAFEVV